MDSSSESITNPMADFLRQGCSFTDHRTFLEEQGLLSRDGAHLTVGHVCLHKQICLSIENRV